MKCYLDNAATMPLSSEMKSYLISVLDVFGNPSSSHSEGVKSNKLIQDVRVKVAQFICANSYDNIYFTSSGSASNTLAIQGFVLNNRCKIYYLPTVHKSILKTIDNLKESYDISVVPLKVDSCGCVDITYLKCHLCGTHTTPFVILDYANSEIGTIQNVKEIVDVVHKYRGKVLVDCTGSISSIPLNVTELNVDIATFSAHKIGALKGTGVLYKKDDVNLRPLVFGTQEQGLFAGTENLVGILSLGKAIDLIKYDKTSYNRDFVWDNIKNIDGVFLVGALLDNNRLINNLYVCVQNVSGNDIVAVMDDMYSTQISTGSACNNGEASPSSTLLAIGFDKENINNCIRISFSGDENKEELQEFCRNFSTCVKMLRGF